MNSQSLSVAFATLFTVATSTYAAGEHPQGGTITVPIITPTFVEDFNPFSNAQVDMVRGTMFEPLWTINTLADDISYRLAESFEYADDMLSITITLKEGLTWSDGESLTADDVVFSLSLGKDDGTLDKTGKWSDGLIKSINATDDRTVVIEFTRKDATFDWFVDEAFIVPEHIWRDVDDKITFSNANPVGSGPITEVKTVRNNQIEICRNPNYYKADEGLPYLDCIKFRQYTDNQQIQPALMNDEIDWGSNFIPDVETTFVARDPEHHGFWYPANDLINVYMNTREAPFDNVAFRQAFSLALDRPTIVDLAAYGYPTVATHVTGIGEYFKASLNPDINEKFDYLAQYDPDAAKAALADAGYKDTDGDGFVENPDGSAIDFDIEVPNGWTDWVQTAQMIAEYLGEAGIKASAKTLDWSLYDRNLKEGTYQASINWSTTGADPIMAYRDYFHVDRVGLSWQANHGMASEEMSTLIDEYSETIDPKRRSEILATLMEYTGENLPFVPVFNNATWYQYNSTDIGGWPTEDNPTVQPVFYSSGRKLLVFESLYQK